MFIDVYYFNDQLDGGPSTPFPDEKGASLHRPSQLWARWSGEILCQQGSCASWAAGWDNSTGYQWWHTIPTTHIEAKQKQVIRGRCSEKAQNSWQVDQIQQAFLMVGNMIPLRFGGELPSYRYVYIYLKVFQHGNEKSANSISHFLSTYRCNFPSNKHEYIQDYSSKASIDIVTQFNPFSTHLQIKMCFTFLVDMS